MRGGRGATWRNHRFGCCILKPTSAEHYPEVTGPRGSGDTRTAAVDRGLFFMAFHKGAAQPRHADRRRSAPQLIPSDRTTMAPPTTRDFLTIPTDKRTITLWSALT